MFGFLNIDKPQGMTSHDVVAFLRKKLKIKQIGHSGTLDPLATGVLPVAIGKTARLLEYLEDDKAYIAGVQFGKVSDTYDVEGKVEIYSDEKIEESALKSAMLDFVGDIIQTPPAYSAVHYKGKRLYELAREGIIPDDIPARQVNVEFINLLNFDYGTQTATLEIACSKGTYIRSIVHDMGQKLSVGAIMSELRRTKAGSFDLKSAVKIDENTCAAELQDRLINPLDVLLYTHKALTDEEFHKVKNGGQIVNSENLENGIIILKYQDKIVAVAQAESDLIKMKKVML